jgi:diguanylate cyclase
LIFMDLDRFKVINDCYGHLAGSQVLREVGFLLKRIVDGVDATVARYGGDEFVLLLPDTSLDEALRIGEEIREVIEKHTYLSHDYGPGMPALHQQGVISASIGVAQYLPNASAGSSETAKSELLKRADAAMYKAKSLGRNQVIVSRAGEEMPTLS